MSMLAFLGSPADLAIVFVLALIVFGPKRLPEVGKQLGSAMREFRKIADEVTGAAHSVRSEVESVYQPVLSVPTVSRETSSATVEKVVAHSAYDQEAAPLMEPVVSAVPAVSIEPEKGH